MYVQTNQVILWVKRKREQNWKGTTGCSIDTAYPHYTMVMRKI